jgi:hypothetical protein
VIAVALVGVVLQQRLEAIIASLVIGASASIFRPQLAFAYFVSSGVWKTAPVFGAVDSPLPTVALLLGWSTSVALSDNVTARFGAALRTSAVLFPLTVWLFVSTFISHTDPEGYREALRFLAVVILPALLVALHVTRQRLLWYVAALFISATLIAVLALGGAVIAGTLWTKALLLWRENEVVFGRTVAMGFVAGMCLTPVAWRSGTRMTFVYVGTLACATAVAHSTSRGAALAAMLCGILVLALLVVHRDRALEHRKIASLVAVTAAIAFLAVSAMTFFPTGRGVRTLTAVPSELPQFVQVPLLSQSLPTPRSQALTGTAASVAPSAAASARPSVSASLTPSPDPARVYESDLALAYRVERYRIAAAQFIASPLIGLGYTHGIYARDGQSYAHNLFLEVASELGLVGLACLAVLLIAVGSALTRIRDSWELTSAAVVLACIFAMTQTSGNLTINRLFFVLCVAVLTGAALPRNSGRGLGSPAPVSSL